MSASGGISFCECGDCKTRAQAAMSVLEKNDNVIEVAQAKCFLSMRGHVFHYKCRTDSAADDALKAWTLWSKAGIMLSRIIIAREDEPDAVFNIEFYSTNTISEICAPLVSADEDLHIIYQSLNYADVYTGERTFSGPRANRA